MASAEASRYTLGRSAFCDPTKNVVYSYKSIFYDAFMLTLQEGPRARRRAGGARFGLAIAGGGPLGGIYELGVIRALEESLKGVLFTRMHVYVGVSSGSFIAAGLANQLSAAQMCRIFINSAAPEHPFKPELFVRPAMGEYLTRARRVPKALATALTEMARRPLSGPLSASLGSLSQLIPSGFLDNERLRRFLEQVFSVPGRTNDFRKLELKLFVVAVDLDSGQAVRFGYPGFDHVPISKAVQASAALPGLYPPVEIDGRYYVDGALRRTLHASVALDQDIDLLIGINPLVPYHAGGGPDQRNGTSLAEGGLPRVLSQALRAMIQSRMEIGIKKYRESYPRTDLCLIEPDRQDSRIFLANVFNYSDRHALCDHAYQATRRDLLANYDRLSERLALHGVELRRDVLEDKRDFTTSLATQAHTTNAVASRLHRALDQLEHLIHASSSNEDGSNHATSFAARKP